MGWDVSNLHEIRQTAKTISSPPADQLTEKIGPKSFSLYIILPEYSSSSSKCKTCFNSDAVLLFVTHLFLLT
jgi:hypothetical protein